MTAEHPPAFEPTGSIELTSVSDSKIISVSLYSSRAEITRLYRFTVKTGQNQVNISGLPNVLEPQSLRVEGRGAATIHDVTVSTAKGEHVPTSSPELAALLSKKEKTSNALARCEKSIASLEQYLASLTVQHLEVSKLESVMENYDATGAKLDAKKSELTEQIRSLDVEIEQERARIAVPHENDKLRVKAAIGVFAQAEGDVEIALIYAVPRATWTAFYDIRVDMSTKEDPINLIYKAAITQSTGESWDDVPLTLETSTPTFGLAIPQLPMWNLDVDRYLGFKSKSRVPAPGALMSRERENYRERSRGGDWAAGGTAESVSEDELEPMQFGGASVTSKGNFSATFRVPGMVSIPSDGEAHNFTIVQLSLKAEMSWISVPKVDTKAHINVGEFCLSDVGIPLTCLLHSAGENHERVGIHAVGRHSQRICRRQLHIALRCPSRKPERKLRLPPWVRLFLLLSSHPASASVSRLPLLPCSVDPSIRITYHPVIKKLSQSGFYTKTANYVFSQRITVFNTKSVPISRLKIVDQIPTSQNSQIEVKLVSPVLTLPTKDNPPAVTSSILKGPKSSNTPAAPQVLSVARGVVAQWNGVDEPDCEVESLGLDRKLNWVCEVAAQAKINLAMEWEVTVSPASAKIVGL
ncbi:hypothetical protein MSAN_01332500 [Mycena sanguinolenta]|uniref:Mucoidy inhibitor A n=1 Tax=Mycena sanguinolenta TaxID=230812 RepID=A0A8H6YG51_9AGAR|nr:hypothetical protein MSAN_01332500 [Mycena sanguinolenta]